uniref:Uncharacterized protein n=1 Tax=Arundo donax TaxID=35708 RepID=A0A0A9BGE0_ARUDO
MSLGVASAAITTIEPTGRRAGRRNLYCLPAHRDNRRRRQMWCSLLVHLRSSAWAPWTCVQMESIS